MSKRLHKRHTLFLTIALLLFIIGCVVFLYLKNMRDTIKEDSKEELLASAVETERDISREIEEHFKALTTIRELLGSEYDIGMEAAKKLANPKEVYGIDYIGLVDRDLIFYGSDGAILPDVPKASIKKTLDGENEIHRIEDEHSGDGIVFSIPYWRNGKIEGALCAKHMLESFVEMVIAPVENASVLVVGADGSVVLPARDFNAFVKEGTWEELYSEMDSWPGRADFFQKILSGQGAVAAARSKNSGQVYFAAIPVKEHPELFVVCITNGEVVNTRVFSSMFFVSLLLVVLLVCMLLLLAYSIRSYMRSKKEIYEVAYVDSLTGLPSKVKHKQDAQVMIDSQDSSYAYISFDIDNFKFINEMFGYEYGNHVLCHVAAILFRHTKNDELCSRVSSDNFAMLWKNDTTRDELTERIQAVFTEITEFNGKDSELNIVTIKFSCGVFIINEPIDINTVRANANMARLESKKKVFKEIVYYSENLKAQRLEERELEYDAKTALKKGEFVVYYQPKFDVTTEKIIGAEALVRWNHPQRGLLAPGYFIPLFESNGFIIELDMYVLDCVCELIESMRRQGVPMICISVNLSRAHLYDQNLMDQILGIVKVHNVKPSYIEFELTETAIYDEMDTLLRTMKSIKKEGFRLSMDDFGSGYSSLNLLRRLPVDVLKLDRGFLEDCDATSESNRDKRIVVHVISMAKDLEMTVLAEGVETKEQKDFLQSANCDMIQGFYYAKPMPEAEFFKLYSESSKEKTNGE